MLDPDGQPQTVRFSRENVIRAVQTPLGFFSLVVLVVEAMLGVLAGFCTGTQRTILVWGILALVALLVLVVTFLAYKQPQVLVAASNPASDLNIGPHLERIEKVLERLDQIGRYASTGALIAAISGLEDELSSRPHCHAGGRTITPILLENLPRTVNEFHEMLRGNITEIKLSEHHLVDNFLRNLVESIPIGTTWFGITRLQSREAWGREAGTVAYCEFQEIAERRTQAHELNFCRLWCFEDDDHFERVREVMDRQQQAGFNIRYIVGSQLDDISLLWAPDGCLKKAIQIKDPALPFEQIKSNPSEFRPLCAFEFEPPRGGRELEELKIVTGEEQFKQLFRYFQDEWRKATVL